MSRKSRKGTAAVDIILLIGGIGLLSMFVVLFLATAAWAGGQVFV